MTQTYRAFVYRPYYYNFEDKPYYESMYIAPNNEKDIVVTINDYFKLKNGNLVEKFETNNNYIWYVLIFIIVLYLFYIYK